MDIPHSQAGSRSADSSRRESAGRRTGDDSVFDVALICANGHVLSDAVRERPELNANFCPACGEGTLAACGECDTPIRGRLHGPAERSSALAAAHPLPPRYCHECGEPFPWTAERLRAADEIAEQLDDLTDEERDLLKSGFRDIITDNPRTEIAALRVRRVAEAAGKGAGQVLLEVVEHLASETARRLIFGA